MVNIINAYLCSGDGASSSRILSKSLMFGSVFVQICIPDYRIEKNGFAIRSTEAKGIDNSEYYALFQGFQVAADGVVSMFDNVIKVISGTVY